MPTVDPRAHHELFHAAQETFGAQQADTLMTMLSQSDELHTAIESLRNDIARAQHSVDELETRVDLRFEAFGQRIDEFETRVGLRFEVFGHKPEGTEHRMASQTDRALREQTRTLTFALMGSLLTVGAINLTALALVA